MEEIMGKVDRLIHDIKESDIYQDYIKLAKGINEDEELKNQVDSLRSRIFQFQKESPSESMFEESSELEREYSELQNNPIVNEYLDAELALCKMLRNIGMRINEEMEIHLPF